MLKTRVITALVLLVGLFFVLQLHSFQLFLFVTHVFLAAAAWENFRLFGYRFPGLWAAALTVLFTWMVLGEGAALHKVLFLACAVVWLLRLGPSLAMRQPELHTLASRLLSGIYGMAIVGCFIAIVLLFERSALYLVSVMAIVWVADVGAYFAGKALGKHKLAPSISLVNHGRALQAGGARSWERLH